MKNKKLLFGLVVFVLGSIASFSAIAQDWISLGPDNVSGRSRAIVFDRFNDKVIYAGGVAGGLYVSVNDGKNWQEINLGQGANLAVTSIAQDNNGVIYVGTGESAYMNTGFGINNERIGMLGGGVYKSNQPSQTNWSSTLSNDQDKYNWIAQNLNFEILDFTVPEAFNNGDGKAFINSIAVNQITNDVYVATHGAGLFKLSQDASSWTNVAIIPNTSFVDEIVISKNGNIATAYNDGELKVSLSTDNFTTNPVIFGANQIKPFDAKFMMLFRTRLAYGIKNPNKLYIYTAYADSNVYKDVLFRTDDVTDIQWKQTTPASYSNAAGNYQSMSIAVDDRAEMEVVYLGGRLVYRGYNANNSDIYYWEGISRYTNLPNDVNGVRTSPSFVSSGVNQIIIKENPQSLYDSTYIAVATNGGIHVYSSDSMTFQTRWRLSTKNMITTQFYSVGVAPDASVIGGTEANGTVYIHNPNELGTIKNGDVIWTVNSPGYNPSTNAEFTTSGGNVAVSQFERILPTSRKSFILSRPYLGMARTYGDNGDFTTVNDQVWNYGPTLFYSGINDNATMAQFEPTVTPMLLWESTTATDALDSVNMVIDANTAVNGQYNSEWREGSWIVPGDSVLVKSMNMGYPFWHTFADSLQYNQDTVILVQNPVQSRLFFANSQSVYMSFNINDYTASPLQSATNKISFLRVKNIPALPIPGSNPVVYAPTEEVITFGVTKDGNTLFIASRIAGTDSSNLYRINIGGIDFSKVARDKGDLNLPNEVIKFPRLITSISVDRNDGNNMLVSFGKYISSNSNLVLSTNALAVPFSSAVFSEVVNKDIEEEVEISKFIPNNKPVFSTLIESVKNTSSKAYIGAEDGIYYTPDFKGTPSTTQPGKIEISWKKIENFPNVPVFQLTQQTMRLPFYQFYNRIGQNVTQTTFARTELPGAIYAATYGKGLYATLADTIEADLNLIGIEDQPSTAVNSTMKIFPNPATNQTTIQYSIDNTSNVTLMVYDMNGRLLSSLDKGRQAQGIHTIQMNCQGMNKGVYMVKIITGNTAKASKLIIQ